MVLLDGEKPTVIQTRCPFGFLLRAKYAYDKCRRRYLVAPVMMGFFSLSFFPNTGGRDHYHRHGNSSSSKRRYDGASF
jgi:hypothetical protein